MGRNKDESPACRVYTVCDESRYLIVRNVPALGCGNELMKLFAEYGEIEECKPMDAEDCEAFTDVYWIKFLQISNARFAKRKLDEAVFLGNHLQVSYAPNFESLSDTKEKLEGRRKEILNRINSRCKGSKTQYSLPSVTGAPSQPNWLPQPLHSNQMEHVVADKRQEENKNHPIKSVSSTMEYFSSPSMNATVQLVRDKLDKIKSNSRQHAGTESTVKKPRLDNRRRI